jgi:hypothetical protein
VPFYVLSKNNGGGGISEKGAPGMYRRKDQKRMHGRSFNSGEEKDVKIRTMADDTSAGMG